MLLGMTGTNHWIDHILLNKDLLSLLAKPLTMKFRCRTKYPWYPNKYLSINIQLLFFSFINWLKFTFPFTISSASIFNFLITSNRIKSFTEYCHQQSGPYRSIESHKQSINSLKWENINRIISRNVYYKINIL